MGSDPTSAGAPDSSATKAADQILKNDEKRKPLAVVGSQDAFEEEMFGAVFDGVILRRFWTFVKPYQRTLFVAMIGVVIFTITQISIPLLIRFAIDKSFIGNQAGLELLHIVVIGFIAVVVVNYLANMAQEFLVGRVAGHLLFDLRRAMYAHLQVVSLSFMDKTEVGRLMSRLQGDVNSLQEFLETSIFALGDFVLLIGICSVLLWLDFRLGVLTLAVVPALLVVRVVWLPYARRAFLTARETSSAVNGALAENVHGIRAIQSMNREKLNYQLFGEKAKANLMAHLRASQFSNIMVPIVDTLTGLAMVIVVLFGGDMVLEGNLELGVMVAFLFYIQRFFDPIRSLTIQYSIMQRAMASGQRIFEVLDVPLAVKDNQNAITLHNHDGSVEFDNVSFAYEPDRPVLKGISFRVEAGEMVALVGPTGSGKTSVTSLLHRFYDVDSGSIRIGGHDVRDIALDSIGAEVGMVLQEPFLFSGTVLDNIRYQKLDASRDEIESAARTVGAHDFINALPEGYDTELDQRGSNLSLGQRQLISFARALVADTRVLILDEATANIDSYTEREIQQALAQLLKGRTAIVIAHRLATIRGADRILVLSDGEIIEKGNHESLVSENGLYARLYKLNQGSFDDL